MFALKVAGAVFAWCLVFASTVWGVTLLASTNTVWGIITAIIVGALFVTATCFVYVMATES